jgi:hypothetical protein
MSYKITKGAAKTNRHWRLLAAVGMFMGIVAGSLPTAHAVGPTVSVTSPTNGTVHQGNVTLSANAGVGTLGVTFKISGYAAPTFAEDTLPPYTVNWDSSVGTLNHIDYTITAEARGLGGKTVSAPVKIKLNNAPAPNTTIVVGDSVTQQSFDPNADNTPTYTANAPGVLNTNFKQFSYMGWDVADVQGTVSGHAIFRWPQKFVVAMGLNDAVPSFFFGGDGWTNTGTNNDLDRFRTLINTVHPTTCVAIILPGYGATGDTPWFGPWVTEIDKARADLAALEFERPHTKIFDWQDVIDQNPQYVDNDGIHLLTPNTTWQQDTQAAANGMLSPVDQTAADARQNFYWDAAAQCTI